MTEDNIFEKMAEDAAEEEYGSLVMTSDHLDDFEW